MAQRLRTQRSTAASPFEPPADADELVVQDMFLNAGLPETSWHAGWDGHGVTSEIDAIMRECGAGY